MTRQIWLAFVVMFLGVIVEVTGVATYILPCEWAGFVVALIGAVWFIAATRHPLLAPPPPAIPVPPDLPGLASEIAAARAEQLLSEYLEPCQAWMLKRLGFFYQRAANGKTYALHDGYFMIEIGTDGKPVQWWGLHVKGFRPSWLGRITQLPLADSLLSQILVLRTDPTLLELRACHYPPLNPFNQRWPRVLAPINSGRWYPEYETQWERHQRETLLKYALQVS